MIDTKVNALCHKLAENSSHRSVHSRGLIVLELSLGFPPSCERYRTLIDVPRVAEFSTTTCWIVNFPLLTLHTVKKSDLIASKHRFESPIRTLEMNGDQGEGRAERARVCLERVSLISLACASVA